MCIRDRFNLDACKTYEWKVATKCNTENISTQSETNQFTTSGCKLNEDAQIQNETWQVFPNPAKKMLHINLNNVVSKRHKTQLKVYDPFGKLHLIKDVPANDKSFTTLNVSALSTGFYYLYISNNLTHLSKKIQIYTEE